MQAADRVLMSDIAAVGVAGDHAPACSGNGGQLLGVVAVAAFDKVRRVEGGSDQVGLAEAVGAGEAADEQGAGRADAPEIEVGEAGVEGGIGVQGDPALPGRRVGVDAGKAGDGDAGGSLGVWAIRNASDHEGAAAVRSEVPCVLREIG